MNRTSQRRGLLGASKKPPNTSKNVEEILSPKSKGPNKSMKNRCCFYSPESNDFAQLVEFDTSTGKHTDQYQQILREQYGFDPLTKIPQERMDQLKDIVKMLCTAVPKPQNTSQYVNDGNQPMFSYVETSDGSQWQNVENTDEIEEFLNDVSGVSNVQKKSQTTKTAPTSADFYVSEKLTKQKYKTNSPIRTQVHIYEKPRVKVIAEKFRRFKNKDIEVRKLEEKLVCLEYDVFEGSDSAKPVQKLRAFFSIKPTGARDNDQKPAKNDAEPNFLIAEEDLEKLNEREIEIIDGKISENQSYLKDLRYVLRRKKEVFTRKNKNSLDLMYLYEIARNDKSQFTQNGVLTKWELQEVKDLILNRCNSSVNGINRRKLKAAPYDDQKMLKGSSIISQSFFNELMRESAK